MTGQQLALPLEFWLERPSRPRPERGGSVALHPSFLNEFDVVVSRAPAATFWGRLERIVETVRLRGGWL
jgi:hypothetical protein